MDGTLSVAVQNPTHRAWGEIAAVVVTGATFLVFENVLHVKLPFLIPCVLLWTAYIALRLRSEPGLAARWGLSASAVKPALPACLAFFAAGALGLLAYRLAAGWRPLPPSAPLLFAAYPVWAFLQQFVIQALVAGNLERLGAPRWVLVPVAALLFGAAHLPDLPLAALCAGAGLVWTPLFLRTRSLYPLALSHAWLGALAYSWLLERDPWRELFP
jgi:hypothetical protein